MLNGKSLHYLAIVSIWLPMLTVFADNTGAVVVRPVDSEKKELLEVNVHRLTVDPKSNNPVVILADGSEERALLIWIGFFEARAISMEMQGVKPHRPLTHDLLGTVIQKAKSKVRHIVITHMRENTYFAKIVMEIESAVVEIDARPSDSIVMALKFKVPIFVSKNLFNDMAIALQTVKDIEKKYGLSLQELNPALAEYFSFGSTDGVLVSSVRKDSRAEKDGIKTGDIFVEIGEQSTENIMSMRKALSNSEISVKAKIFRNNRVHRITLHLK